MPKNLKRHFSKEDVQVANKCMKRWSRLVIREIEIKPIIRHHPTLARMAKKKKRTKNNVGQDVENLDLRTRLVRM